MTGNIKNHNGMKYSLVYVFFHYYLKGNLTGETQNDTSLCCLHNLIRVNEFCNLLNHVKERGSFSEKLFVCVNKGKVLLYLGWCC